jgi:acetylornithine deacetylase/succinyl-diaminopimelate desuccinylase-like protein
MFHNTVSATIVSGGEKINVPPRQVQVDLDGRLLPGFGPERFEAELRGIIGRDVELHLTKFEPYPEAPDLHLFDLLAGVIRRLDPEGVPIPFLLPAITDARHFARLGIQSFGFTPMKLPPDFRFLETVHAADERIPIAGLEFGRRALREAIKDYAG